MGNGLQESKEGQARKRAKKTPGSTETGGSKYVQTSSTHKVPEQTAQVLRFLPGGKQYELVCMLSTNWLQPWYTIG